MVGVVALLAGTVLAGCTAASAPTSSAYPTAPPPVTPPPTPPPTPRPAGEALPFAIPAVRWDYVARGPLPVGCALQGRATVTISGGSQAYATGPSLTCPASRHYLVRGVVKLAVKQPFGWIYVAHAGPSAPVRDQAPSQLTPAKTCTTGQLLRAVASFVLTWPDGHQVRYKIYGRAVACA